MTNDNVIPPGFRGLIHGLNQRCRAEFDRAERLQAELDDLKGSRAWSIFAWLRSLRRSFKPVVATDPLSRVGSEGPPRLMPADTVLSAPSPKVSILIPFKDQLGLLRNCLRSLRR